MPATHVTLDIPPGKSEPEKQIRPGAAYRSEPVYYGTMREEFRHEAPPPVTIRREGRGLLASDPDPSASEYVVREKMNGLFEATVPASSVQVRAFGTSVPDHRDRSSPADVLRTVSLRPARARGVRHDSWAPSSRGSASQRVAKAGRSGSVSWAGFPGARHDQGRCSRGGPDDDASSRGDIIVFVTTRSDGGFHTVIRVRARPVRDGEPMVYSIARWRSRTAPRPLGPLGGLPTDLRRDSPNTGHGRAGAPASTSLDLVSEDSGRVRRPRVPIHNARYRVTETPRIRGNP